ncbi:hypothetical protein SISNIDRAFT_533627 [Sistotremastrum niveocremeum HHB9708]|uniref:Uncharacterized protein n=1 Tax=Sistotremastrum niveocremeum HHB9708 TaxID=1314777 RepID=A0A164YAH6_9AGAM|nr:hypothetical protein SISNIDRAFT_533627 [Sistotremastrum niveocremeum HHB9708]
MGYMSGHGRTENVIVKELGWVVKCSKEFRNSSTPEEYKFESVQEEQVSADGSKLPRSLNLGTPSAESRVGCRMPGCKFLTREACPSVQSNAVRILVGFFSHVGCAVAVKNLKGAKGHTNSDPREQADEKIRSRRQDLIDKRSKGLIEKKKTYHNVLYPLYAVESTQAGFNEMDWIQQCLRSNLDLVIRVRGFYRGGEIGWVGMLGSPPLNI